MTIGQIARHAGLTPRALRFYEAEGLLPHPPRTLSGYRMYGESELELIRLVSRLRAVGLGVADIREVVRLREQGVPPPDRIVALLQTRIAQVDRDVSALQQRRGVLAEVLHRMLSNVDGVRLCRVVSSSTSMRAD